MKSIEYSPIEKIICRNNFLAYEAEKGEASQDPPKDHKAHKLNEEKSID